MTVYRASLRSLVTALSAITLSVAGARCDQHQTAAPNAVSLADASVAVTPRRIAHDAGPPADRGTVRRVITFYRWQSTERGDETTDNQPIEHGTPKLHVILEVHRGPANEGWITVAGIPGAVSIPESRRMRPLGSQGEWHVPAGLHTEYSLEQFGGDVRGDEPIRVFLANAPEQRVDLALAATPVSVRLPVEGTLPATPSAAAGQYDAIVVFVIPMTNRRNGRYLVEAVDMLPEPGGFAANGVMTRIPTGPEIERYARWMRQRNGIGHTPPPVPMAPIDR